MDPSTPSTAPRSTDTAPRGLTPRRSLPRLPFPRRFSWAPILLIGAGLLNLGCFSIGITSTAPEKQVEAAISSVLTGRDLGEDTRQLLRLALLDEVAEREPKLAIRSLVALYDRQWGPDGLLAPATSAAELAVVEGRRLEESDPEAALGFYLTAADLAQDAVLRALSGDISPLGPRLRFAAELYNFAVGRVVPLSRSLVFPAPGETAAGWPERFEFDAVGPLGVYTVELAGDVSLWNPSIFQLRPANEIGVQGLENRHRNRGLGAPLVVTRRELPERSITQDGFFRSHWNFYALSAIARFSQAENPRRDIPGRHRRASLTLHDPLLSEHIELRGVEFPLEADFTAPLAVLAEMFGTSRDEKSAALRAERYLDEAGIYLIEPYREDKIPLVLVHGLNSSAFTWLEMTNDLRGDSLLREHYQIWAFNYPSGLPFSISSAMLRQSMERMLDHFDPEKSHEQMRRMVMVGHSMGGLITRAQASDAGNVLWDSVALRPFEEAELSPADEALLRRAYLPEPLPELSRAIFIAAPHRGSELAAGRLGRLASSLVKLPAALADQFRRLSGAGILNLPATVDVPDAIDSLSTESPILGAFEGLPILVPFHTIVGDRNLGDEIVSDGFVPYESSRLEGAESELVIPSGHNVHKTSAAIAEVRRILLLHLRESEDCSQGVEIGHPCSR